MKYLKKTGAITLSTVMVLGMAAGNVSMAAGKIEKEETVYVNQEADGRISEITVSDWLKNVTGTSDISDVSNLTEIENVKGDEAFEQGSDGAITWKADNADIYYQGKTDEDLPVSVTVSYKLDGKAVMPSEIAGKSGKMEMIIKYENNATYEDKINGVTTRMNTPFLMASAVILPIDNFSNVKISQGKMVSEGSNQILVVYGMPGLAESLNLSGDIRDEIEKKINDTVTITADVTDFSMKPIYTVATSEEFSDIDLDDESDIHDLDDAVDDLVDATDELISGSSDLSEGLTTLQDSFETYANGMKDVKKGASDLNTGVEKLAEGISQYTDGVKSLTDGASQYVSGSGKLAAGVNEYVAGEKLIDQGAKTLMDQSAALPAGYSAFSEGLLSYITGVNQIANAENTQKLAVGSQAVSDGIQGINAALGSLDVADVDYDSAINALNTAKESLGDDQTDAIAAIDAAVNQLQTAKSKQAVTAATIEGLKGKTASGSELANGALTIAGAMKQLNENASTLVAGGESLKAGNQEMSAGIKGVTDGIAALYSGIQTLSANNETLLSGANQLTAKGLDLTTGIAKLDGSTSTLTKSTKELADGANDLSKGVNQLNNATQKVGSGVNELQHGSVDLLDGMHKFKEEGTGKLQNEYNENIKTVLDRFQSLTGDTANYKTFSGIAEGMEGSVKFVFQTAEISSDKQKKIDK
ncbi:MAG: hypothetical protein K2I10_02060 [Lachnospiraceae bacterium]|nr:hypothetical protein [Lachnospiraceae bacterium]